MKFPQKVGGDRLDEDQIIFGLSGLPRNPVWFGHHLCFVFSHQIFFFYLVIDI